MTARLLRAALLIILAVLAVLEVPLGLLAARTARAELVGVARRDAMVIAALVEDLLEQGVAEDFEAVLGAFTRRTGTRTVVVDRSGALVHDTGPLPGAPDLGPRPELRAALGGDFTAGARFTHRGGRGLLHVAVPVTSAGKVHGAVRLTVPTDGVDARIARIVLGLVAGGLVVLIVTGLVAWRLALGVTRPVSALTGVADRLGAGDFGSRAPEVGPPELRRLARAVNTMADRLRALLEAQVAFVADASHQLRSPLTALRLRLENLEADLAAAPPDNPVAASAHAELEAALREADRLNRLVGALLALARAEGRRATRQVVDVRAELADAADRWGAAAAEHGVRVTQDAPALHLLALPEAVGQMLDNLLANALRFAPTGSVVELHARREGDRVALHVRDHGPGMDALDRRRAFDRFWRAPGAGGDQHFGLGLAIVRRLALACGGEAELRAAPGGGLDAVVLLDEA